jgi:hypothetical protein
MLLGERTAAGLPGDAGQISRSSHIAPRRLPSPSLLDTSRAPPAAAIAALPPALALLLLGCMAPPWAWSPLPEEEAQLGSTTALQDIRGWLAQA